MPMADSQRYLATPTHYLIVGRLIVPPAIEAGVSAAEWVAALTPLWTYTNTP
jgi:hypothetical protein